MLKRLDLIACLDPVCSLQGIGALAVFLLELTECESVQYQGAVFSSCVGHQTVSLLQEVCFEGAA